MISFSDQTIPIPCPGCGYKTEKTIAWLKANPELIRDGCGAKIRHDNEQFSIDTQGAEKDVNNALRAARRPILT